MANIKFYGSSQSDKSFIVLDCFVNDWGEVSVLLEDNRTEHYSLTSLDIPTAIAFRKHLAQQIAKAKEVQNG